MDGTIQQQNGPCASLDSVPYLTLTFLVLQLEMRQAQSAWHVAMEKPPQPIVHPLASICTRCVEAQALVDLPDVFVVSMARESVRRPVESIYLSGWLVGV
jgi:hypothetical protein